ncbi:hypothetical protein MIND_00973600 [Mycena indigotica]|uniref:Uncharacterized protein n=1 Tax=Mycena indigotica TaxID=2126181 RepID=A0A8H6SGG9_9AGAR|nr:uncharacterized protein MIND_00973600 [Mycena indigotica]KAF7297400.1 hypothetical protein MIND_00973600 [Mycena indigotica]
MKSPYIELFLLYALNLVAAGAQLFLKALNIRFRSHGEERRRSIASIFAIIGAKTLIFVLSLPPVLAVVLSTPWDGFLVTRTHLCAKVIMLTYLFDLTYRRANAILWVHHTLTFAAILFILRNTSPSAPGIAGLWISIPAVFAGVGIGVTDIGGDIAVLLYYIAPQSIATAQAIRACGGYLMLGRATGWSIVLAFVSRGHWKALELNFPMTIVISVVLLGWVMAEVEEIFAILGMSERMRSKVTTQEKS